MEAVMISVIVPTHNRRGLLEKKLRSLESQAQPFEVVVIADGCTDDTVLFLKNYQPNYALQFFETPGNGAAFARNAGAKVAKGERLLFSDDDVIPSADWIKAHREASSANTVVVGKLVLPEQVQQGATFTGPKAFWWNATGANTSMSKQLFVHAGGYDETFHTYGGEDPDLGWRLKRTGATFEFSSQAVAEHWDEGYSQTFLTKAFAAGKAHVRVWQKYQASEIAWALGVHPIMLRVKLALLPLLKTFGNKIDYELEYAKGALSELQKRDSLSSS
jgi:glycosyltransferase involved in cell wall biosynthesis